MPKAINPSNFTTIIDNPFLTYEPGTTFISESPDGSLVVNFNVTRQTKVIDGVTCVVVHDTSTEDGKLIENTFDYFAQDKDGNVWYFGEDTQQIENGKVVGTEGTWRAGVDGAQPGIVMEAHPNVGDQYDQENAPGVAQDHAEVVSLNASVHVPYGSSHHDLRTAETTPLEPGALEHKVYALGVGNVYSIDDAEGDVEQLVKIRVDGTSQGDKLRGYAGGDELNGNGGNDSLNGLAGRDTVHGNSGNDLLDGGNDKAADFLYGDSGNDKISVRAADHAFGGSGNDLINLFDNTNFGSIDGGSQQCSDLAHSRGDLLHFNGGLDLTKSGVSERIDGIESISMKDGQGNDSLKLSAHDVLDLGTGTFDPKFCSHDTFSKGDALRVDGDSGDKCTLSGGNWSQIDPNNAPHGYDVFACHTSSGNAYVLVQEDVVVTT